MRAAIVILSLALLAGASIPSLSGASPRGETAESISQQVPRRGVRTAPPTLTGGALWERAIVFDAMARFAPVPGELPPMEVRILGESGCGGHSGLFRAGIDSWQVDICDVSIWVILHEMGHAWTALNLSRQERNRFVARWGLETWNGQETPWRLRGVELAADTIAWGLVEEPVGCHSPGGPIARRLLAFRQLTGVDSRRNQCAKPVSGSRRSERGQAVITYVGHGRPEEGRSG